MDYHLREGFCKWTQNYTKDTHRDIYYLSVDTLPNWGGTWAMSLFCRSRQAIIGNFSKPSTSISAIYTNTTCPEYECWEHLVVYRIWWIIDSYGELFAIDSRVRKNSWLRYPILKLYSTQYSDYRQTNTQTHTAYTWHNYMRENLI